MIDEVRIEDIHEVENKESGPVIMDLVQYEGLGMEERKRMHQRNEEEASERMDPIEGVQSFNKIEGVPGLDKTMMNLRKTSNVGQAHRVSTSQQQTRERRIAENVANGFQRTLEIEIEIEIEIILRSSSDQNRSTGLEKYNPAKCRKYWGEKP